MTPTAAQKTDSMVEELLGRQSVSPVRQRFDSFRVDVLLEDRPTANALSACSVALNLLPRLFKCVRYDGPEAVMGGFPPSHTRRLNYGSGWDAAATLVFGSRVASGARSALYVGSSGWSSYLSTSGPCPWVPPVYNALGSMHAGALAVGEIFKMVVPEAGPEKATHLEYDLVTHGRAEQPVTKPPVPYIVNVGDLTIVGCGAIGQTLCQALASTVQMIGRITLVDPENLDESNEQRYMTAFEETRGMSKIERANGILLTHSPLLRTNLIPAPYENYATLTDINVSDVVVCVDSTATRINTQASLPHVLWNGWTDVGRKSIRYGVSRHSFDGDSACLACYYRPVGASPSGRDMDAAKAGLPRNRIDEILERGEACSRALLEEVSHNTKVPLQRILHFEGRPFQDLLHGDCGMFRLRTGEADAATPAPHQPALAGILLASQLVLARIVPKVLDRRPVSDFDALRVPGHLCLFCPKRHPECLCGDPVYRRAYEEKWETGPDSA